eukprot:18357_5
MYEVAGPYTGLTEKCLRALCLRPHIFARSSRASSLRVFYVRPHEMLKGLMLKASHLCKKFASLLLCQTIDRQACVHPHRLV